MFEVEKPSQACGSFGGQEIAAVGAELDRKLAALLAHLQVPVRESAGLT